MRQDSRFINVDAKRYGDTAASVKREVFRKHQEKQGMVEELTWRRRLNNKAKHSSRYAYKLERVHWFVFLFGAIPRRQERYNKQTYQY